MSYRRLCLLFAAAIALWAPGGARAADDEVTIGFANPLTGPYASSGNRNRAAVELAVADLNRAGGVLGREVRLVAADDACGVERAVAAARELTAAGVRAVVGHMCSHSSLMAAGIYEAADVPMISPSSTHPRLTEEGRQNVFRLIGRDDRQVDLAGDLLADNWGDGAKIAILHDGSTYGEGLAARTRQRLRRRGVVEAIYDAYAPGEGDYTALAARLERAGIDVLYVSGYGPDAGLILRAARERGDDDLQLVGGDGLGMEEFWAAAGPAGEGTVFSSRRDVRGLPEAAAVLAELRARGLGRGGIGGIGAYAAVQVWAQAVGRAGTFDPAAVAEALRRGRYETALGRVAFDDKGDLEGAGWEWQVWTDGAYRPLGWATARRQPWTRSWSRPWLFRTGGGP
jgi:branched-chain amino acid transport system substrate-binding protein